MTRSRNEILSEVDRILHEPNLTRENSARAEQMLALADSLTDKTELRKATMSQRDSELGRVPIAPEPTPADEAFRGYLQCGDSALARELEMRAQSTTTTAGGFLVPQSFYTRLESMLAQADELFGAATVFETANGSAMGFPVLSDEGHGASVVTENGISTMNADLVFAELGFQKCPTFRSNMIICSTELVNNSAFDISGIVADAAAKSFAKGAGSAFVATLLATADSAKTTASPTAILADDIWDLIDSVDEAYASRGSFLMRRSTLTALRKMVTTAGAYVFPEARDADGYPLLAGYRCYISPSMGDLTAAEKVMSFGDHSRFVQRRVRDSLTLKIYNERFAEYSQVGYEAFWRLDGGLLRSATVSPVKYLEMQAGS